MSLRKCGRKSPTAKNPQTHSYDAKTKNIKTHMACACKGTVKTAAGKGGGCYKSAVFISGCLAWLWQMELKKFLCVWMLLWASGTLYLLADSKAKDSIVFWQTKTHLCHTLKYMLLCFPLPKRNKIVK